MKTKSDALERQLESLYAAVPPAPGGLAAGRERLLAEAERLCEQQPMRPATQKTRRQRLPRLQWSWAYKTLAVVLAALVFFVAVGSTTFVAADSLPGDRLYSYKLTVEDARVALARRQSVKAGLLFKFAAERADEIVRLAERGEAVPEQTVERLVRQSERALAGLARVETDEIPALAERALVQVRQQVALLQQAQRANAAADAAAADASTAAAIDEVLAASEHVVEILETAREDPLRLQPPEPIRRQEEHRAGTPTATPRQERSREPAETPTPTEAQRREQEQHREQEQLGTPQTTATPNAEQNREQEQHREREGQPTLTVTPGQEMEQHREREQQPTHTATPQQQNQGPGTDGGPGPGGAGPGEDNGQEGEGSDDTGPGSPGSDDSGPGDSGPGDSGSDGSGSGDAGPGDSGSGDSGSDGSGAGDGDSGGSGDSGSASSGGGR